MTTSAITATTAVRPATAANGSSKAAVAYAALRASCVAFEPDTAGLKWGSTSK